MVKENKFMPSFFLYFLLGDINYFAWPINYNFVGKIFSAIVLHRDWPVSGSSINYAEDAFIIVSNPRCFGRCFRIQSVKNYTRLFDFQESDIRSYYAKAIGEKSSSQISCFISRLGTKKYIKNYDINVLSI